MLGRACHARRIAWLHLAPPEIRKSVESGQTGAANRIPLPTQAVAGLPQTSDLRLGTARVRRSGRCFYGSHAAGRLQNRQLGGLPCLVSFHLAEREGIEPLECRGIVASASFVNKLGRRLDLLVVQGKARS